METIKEIIIDKLEKEGFLGLEHPNGSCRCWESCLGICGETELMLKCIPSHLEDK